MSDHILYNEGTLSSAAAELDRLADILSDVRQRLDAVDTSAEWWDHVSFGGNSGVGAVRTLRNTSASLSRNSTRLAGSTRKAIEIFEQAEANASGLCRMIADPAGLLPYLDETGAVAGGIPGSGWGSRVNDFIWDLFADLIGDGSTFLGYASDVFEMSGMIAKGIPGGVGFLASMLSSFLGNLQEYISSDGAMSVARAVAEFLVETGIDLLLDTLIGAAVIVMAPVCPVGAIIVAGLWAFYNLTAAEYVEEGASDFFLGKDDIPSGASDSPGGRSGRHSSGGFNPPGGRSGSGGGGGGFAW